MARTSPVPLLALGIGHASDDLSVSGAKNPALVGVGGIVVHETENAFRVITKNNEAKRKPYLASIILAF
jgi:RNase P/RNase MRP subunit p29